MTPEQKQAEGRRRRAWARKNGICQGCFRRKAIKGRVRCWKCLKYLQDYQAANRRIRAKNGKCPKCGMLPPEEGLKHCRPCLNVNASQARSYRAAKKRRLSHVSRLRGQDPGAIPGP